MKCSNAAHGWRDAQAAVHYPGQQDQAKPQPGDQEGRKQGRGWEVPVGIVA